MEFFSVPSLVKLKFYAWLNATMEGTAQNNFFSEIRMGLELEFNADLIHCTVQSSQYRALNGEAVSSAIDWNSASYNNYLSVIL